MNAVEEKRGVESWVAFHAPLREGYSIGVYCCLYSKATAVHFYSPAISIYIVFFCFTTSGIKSIVKQVECEKPHIIGGVSYKRPSCWNPVYWTRNLLCYAGVSKRSFFVEGSCLVREVKVLRSLRCMDGYGWLRLRQSKLYPTKEVAQASIPKSKRKIALSHWK